MSVSRCLENNAITPITSWLFHKGYPAGANMLGYEIEELNGVSMHATMHHTRLELQASAGLYTHLNGPHWLEVPELVYRY